MCGIIDFLLREGFQCLNVGKPYNFYRYQYLDKLNKPLFGGVKTSIEVGHLAVMLEKNFKSTYTRSVQKVSDLFLSSQQV